MSAKKKLLYRLGIHRGEFIPEAEVVGAATLNDMALDVDAVLCF